MTGLFGDSQAIALLLFAGFLSNEVWRVIGLVIGGGIDEGSEFLVWVRAVAAAILAGVIAQILISPPGALATVPDVVRYGAVAAGFAVYLAARKSVFAGVVAGEIVVLAGKWWMG
jgi:branched-subunit amino acid transport protein